MTPNTTSTSKIILWYGLFYVGIALLIGYVALLGTLADGITEQAIRDLSIGVGSFAGFAFLLGLLFLLAHIRISGTPTDSMNVKAARILSKTAVLLPTSLVLLLMFSGYIAVWQLSLGQFLLGADDERYRHLIILSGYAGATFGIYAGWNAKTSVNLKWGTSISHGLRVFFETGFLAYAGLWLVEAPFDLIAGTAGEKNWELIVAATIGAALIGIGSFSFMARQATTTPRQPEDGQSFGAEVRLWLQKVTTVIREVRSKLSSRASDD